MSASTKLRITTNQRKVLKLEAQQTAYRSIIEKFNGFRDKYFDVLNGNTWLQSRNTFNRHSAKITQNGVEAKIAGVNVSTSSNATAGNYKVTVNNHATQAKITSAATDSLTATSFKPEDFTSGTHMMSIAVGGTQRWITFEGNANADEVVKNVNKALQVFGKTNDTDDRMVGGSLVEGTGRGRVFYNTNTAVGPVGFMSTERAAISTGVVTELTNTASLGNINDWQTGNNSITVLIDGEARTINFSTVEKDFFANLLDFTVQNPDGTLKLNQPTLAALPSAPASQSAADVAAWEALKEAHEKQAEERQVFNIFNQMMADMFVSEINNKYDAWKGSDAWESTTLTWQERRTVLQSFSDLGFDAAKFAEITANITFDPDTETEQYNTAVNNALNAYINTLSPDQRGTINDSMNEAWYNKAWAEMSTEQRALFDAEVARRDANIRQIEYGRAMSHAYNTMFDKWQRDNGFPGNIPNPAFNPDQPVHPQDNPSIIPNPKYMSQADFREMMGLASDVKGMEDAHGMNWWSQTAMDGRIDITKAAFYGDLTTEQREELGLLLDAIAGEFTRTSMVAENDKTDRAFFLRNTYDEKNAYAANYALGFNAGRSFEAFVGSEVAKFGDTPATATAAANALADHFNKNAITNSLERQAVFADGKKANVSIAADGTVTVTASDKDGNALNLGVFTSESSANADGGFGSDIQTQVNTVSTVSQSTKLSELGLTANAQGNYTFTINGQNFSFGANTTIREMMTAVNTNTKANVEMTFSTLTNTFEIKAKEFGADTELTFADGEQGLLAALGFGAGDYTRTNGQNMSLTINGQTVETASNSYSANGMEITVGPNAVLGADGTFEIVVERDTSAMLDLIKDFVKDYNALIDYVFGYVNEKPDKEYFMLTDTDREELGMTDRQEQKWEERAMKGLLYNDRTLIKLMGDMRVAMFSGIDRGDGTKFGLFSMGISTSDNWLNNGKLVINEQKLMSAIEKDIDLITELFTNREDGIMPKLRGIIDSATKTSGDRGERGLLIQRAGMANQSSATSNAIYDQIKRLNSVIANLELRYQKQQDRYWKIFSNLEQQMGQLNSQGDFVSQMGMNNMWGNNK